MMSLKLLLILLLFTGTMPMSIFEPMFSHFFQSFPDTMSFQNRPSSIHSRNIFKNGRLFWVAEINLTGMSKHNVQVNLNGRNVVVKTKYFDNHSSSTSSQSVSVPRGVDINQLVYQNNSSIITIYGPYIRNY